MGIYDKYKKKINDQKVSGGVGMPLLPGNYTVKCTDIRGGETRKGDPYFEVFFEVLESSNPDQKIGSVFNQFSVLNDDIGLMYAKMVLITLSGLDPANGNDASDIEETNWFDVLELAVSTPKTFLGKLVNVAVVMTPYKNPPKKRNPDGSVPTHFDKRVFMPHASTREAAK